MVEVQGEILDAQRVLLSLNFNESGIQNKILEYTKQIFDQDYKDLSRLIVKYSEYPELLIKLIFAVNEADLNIYSKYPEVINSKDLLSIFFILCKFYEKNREFLKSLDVVLTSVIKNIELERNLFCSEYDPSCNMLLYNDFVYILKSKDLSRLGFVKELIVRYNNKYPGLRINKSVNFNNFEILKTLINNNCNTLIKDIISSEDVFKLSSAFAISSYDRSLTQLFLDESIKIQEDSYVTFLGFLLKKILVNPNNTDLVDLLLFVLDKLGVFIENNLNNLLVISEVNFNLNHPIVLNDKVSITIADALIRLKTKINSSLLTKIYHIFNINQDGNGNLKLNTISEELFLNKMSNLKKLQEGLLISEEDLRDIFKGDDFSPQKYTRFLEVYSSFEEYYKSRVAYYTQNSSIFNGSRYLRLELLKNNMILYATSMRPYSIIAAAIKTRATGKSADKLYSKYLKSLENNRLLNIILYIINNNYNSLSLKRNIMPLYLCTNGLKFFIAGSDLNYLCSIIDKYFYSRAFGDYSVRYKNGKFFYKHISKYYAMLKSLFTSRFRKRSFELDLWSDNLDHDFYLYNYKLSKKNNVTTLLFAINGKFNKKVAYKKLINFNFYKNSLKGLEEVIWSCIKASVYRITKLSDSDYLNDICISYIRFLLGIDNVNDTKNRLYNKISNYAVNNFCDKHEFNRTTDSLLRNVLLKQINETISNILENRDANDDKIMAGMLKLAFNKNSINIFLKDDFYHDFKLYLDKINQSMIPINNQIYL